MTDETLLGGISPACGLPVAVALSQPFPGWHLSEPQGPNPIRLRGHNGKGTPAGGNLIPGNWADLRDPSEDILYAKVQPPPRAASLDRPMPRRERF